MGSGYNWMEPPKTGLQTGFESYLGGEIGKEAPAYEGEISAPMPKGLMDLRGMYSYLLGQGGRGAVGDTAQGFPMPATGAYPGIPMPGILGKAEAGLGAMMETGMPTGTAEWEKARKAQFEQSLQDTWAQQKEAAHMTGGRYGTGLMRTMGEAGGRATLGYETEVGRRQMAAQEAARGRQMGAYGMGTGLGGLLESILMGRMGGATGLEMGIWGEEQEAGVREYQEWLRRQPGYRPEFAATTQIAGQYPGQWGEDPFIGFLNAVIGAGGTAAGAALGG